MHIYFVCTYVVQFQLTEVLNISVNQNHPSQTSGDQISDDTSMASDKRDHGNVFNGQLVYDLNVCFSTLLIQ